MGLFHSHQWEVIQVTLVPPKDGLKGIANISEHLAERLFAGVTTVLMKCPGCGAVRQQEMLGAPKE
jgi:hypothetical protein